jgi:hypothetical protein
MKIGIESLDEAREQIRKAIRQKGPFSHNIVGLVLSGVASEHGTVQANALIQEFNLTRVYGIHPVKEEEAKPIPPPVVEKKVEEPKQSPYERARREANAVIQRLFYQLDGLFAVKNSFVYELVKDNGWEKNAFEIKIQVFPEDHPSYNKKIRVFANLKGNGHYHHTGYKTYIRIDSDDWTVSFKKNWTPTTKDLATKINTKVTEFVQELQSKYEARVQQKETDTVVKEKMAVEFPEAKDVYVTGNRASFYIKEGKLEYNINYDTYSLELSGLTRDQLRRILDIKRAHNGRESND